MPDLLEQASAWLEDQRVKHLTRSVTYVRGEQSVELAATIGQTIFQLDDGGGGVLRVESRDYLITASDLVLDGQATPKTGDRIRETQGDTTFIYEVVGPADEPCWRYSDAYRRTLRVHTKFVATE